ncbi:synaptotagmin-like protein 3 [Aplochiton taeniatus]
MDLGLLQALEREKVLEVLQRDKLLRTIEEDRIRKLKSELQDLRRRGAKSFSRQYGERTCARCQRPLGKFWNSGGVCRGCSHRICSKCRVGESPTAWKCTVCHAYRDVKIRSGEWFLEEKEKKYPASTDRHETVGEKLLQSYKRLSHISIVPPTPPPTYDNPSFSRYEGMKNSKPFTKSVENLMVSFTSHMKKTSKSQHDVRVDQALLTVNTSRRQSCSGRKSLSETDINKVTKLFKGPSLPNLLKKSKDSDQEGFSSEPEDGVSLGSGYSGGKRGSNSSTSTVCGVFEGCSVTGELELALNFNVETSSLEITVSSCSNLTFGDIKRKKCHPYVKIYLLPDKSQSSKLKTAVKRNTTDPVYNEVLQYQVERTLLGSRILQASVWHSGTLKKKVFLGEVLIPLESWRFEDGSSRRFVCYPLSPKPERPEEGAVEQDSGELLVRVMFSSLSQFSWVYHIDEVNIGPHDNGQLTVLIAGAKHLTSKANTGQNTYVKGCLTLPGHRELTLKTPVLKGKGSPEWSHQLAFASITPLDLKDCSLHLALWDNAPFSLSDQPLGQVTLEKGLSWQLVLQKPNMWHDFSLPIQASVNTRRT